ncbi:molecular chaperone DnaJ [bacterium Unc6]|nr:molecular chaperone DnaJ [bacterium Unc6]
MDKDYYRTLGVSRDADQSAIKSSYRQLALKYHPDRNPGDKASEERFKEISEAYEVLSDPQKRATYDQFGYEGLRGAFTGGGFTWSDFTHFDDVEDIFGGSFADILRSFTGFGTGTRRGKDKQAFVELNLEDVMTGAEKTISLSRMEFCNECQGRGARTESDFSVCPRCKGAGQTRFVQGFFALSQTCDRCSGQGKIIKRPCSHCKGKGRVSVERRITIKIPAGVDDGTSLRVGGEGEVSQSGRRGDLYVIIKINKHPVFEKEGSNIICNVPVNVIQAALGANIDIPTLEGKTVSLSISPGTQDGQILRIKKGGLPDLNLRSRADMFVRIIVETPVHLTSEQKRILEEFNKLSRPENTPLQKEFSEKIKKHNKDR